MVKEDIICKKISVFDLVHNHTIALECELKVVSKMPSMKRPAVVFARAALFFFFTLFFFVFFFSLCFFL